MNVLIPRFAVPLALGAAAVPGLCPADILGDWNNQELTQIRTTSMDPLYASRDLAILQVTMYDTVNGVNRTHASFQVNEDAPAGTSMDAAMAAAGLRVLSSLYGASSVFTSLYNTQIAALTDSPAAINQGITWGNYVADTVVNNRASDGASTSNSAYSGSAGQGSWAPTPTAFDANPLRPGWMNVTPFALNTGSQFRPNGPPTLDAAAYGADFNEVKTLGAATGSTRSADQTDIANFWNDPPGTVTTAGHWNQVAQTVSSSMGVNDRARVLAAVNVAMADAAIAAWDAKYTYNSWRPVTAIRDEANRDTGVFYDNPDITGDAAWSPMLDTPVSPEYVSQNSALSHAAAKAMATLLGGDANSFSITADTNGDGTVDMTRNYTSLSGAADEAGASGVYGGTQFNSSVQDGKTLGEATGQYVTSNFFAPVPEPSAAILLLVAGTTLALRRRRLA